MYIYIYIVLKLACPQRDGSATHVLCVCVHDLPVVRLVPGHLATCPKSSSMLPLDGIDAQKLDDPAQVHQHNITQHTPRIHLTPVLMGI